MLDAHAHVMQVKLWKANTRGVTASSLLSQISKACTLLSALNIMVYASCSALNMGCHSHIQMAACAWAVTHPTTTQNTRIFL